MFRTIVDAEFTPARDRSTQYQIHQAIHDLIDPARESAPKKKLALTFRVLSELSTSDRTTKARIAMYSKLPPEPLRAERSSLTPLESTPVDDIVDRGEYTFRILLNATSIHKGSRLELLDAYQMRGEVPDDPGDLYRDYLNRRLEGAAVAHEVSGDWTSTQKNVACFRGRTIYSLLRDVSGTLTVVDADALRSLMLDGIGRQSKFGAGMLLLWPKVARGEAGSDVASGGTGSLPWNEMSEMS